MCYAQDMAYAVRETNSRSITKEKLNDAMTMSDINPGYPSSWISNYKSAEISVSHKGQMTKAEGTNEKLSAEQRSILNAADVGSVVILDVKYKKQNWVTGIVDVDTMMYSVRVVPEVEAEYVGGYDQMTKYFKEKVFNAMSESADKQPKSTTVVFTVDKKGRTIDAQLEMPSGDKELDGLLLKAIKKMPKWKPAEDGNGMKVKQEFEFIIGNQVGC